jgi:hypothetical protein
MIAFELPTGNGAGGCCGEKGVWQRHWHITPPEMALQAEAGGRDACVTGGDPADNAECLDDLPVVANRIRDGFASRTVEVGDLSRDGGVPRV